MLKEGVILLNEEERVNKGEQQDSYLISLKDYINNNSIYNTSINGISYPITVDFIHKLFSVGNSYAIRYDGHSKVGRWYGSEFLFYSTYLNQFFRQEKLRVLSQRISSKNCVQS